MFFKKSSFFYLLLITLFLSCKNNNKNEKIVIAFLDGIADETLQTAKDGFFKALADSGYKDGENIEVIYRNAQGEITVMVQSIDYFKSMNAELITTCPSISTVTAIQRNKEIPVCMMVSPSPDVSGLSDSNNKPPSHLFGVYETQDYIDTAFSLIKELMPNVLNIGVVYNQSEIQSVSAFKRINKVADSLGLKIQSVPLSNSSESKMATEALLNKNIDVFFALPDNVVFASFETILNSCNSKNVPIFTSEAGLVKRGALCAFGADMYQWGYQAGQSAVYFLKHNKQIPQIERVNKRVKMMNKKVADKYGINYNQSFIEF